MHKLNPKGEQVASFQLATNTDKKIDGVASFAVTADGILYQLEFDRYVFVYKSDGTFKSSVKLNPGFVWFPHALAVFPSGQFLIAGPNMIARRIGKQPLVRAKLNSVKTAS